MTLRDRGPAPAGEPRKEERPQTLAGSPWREALFDATLDAVLVADSEGRYLDANAAACDLLGFTLDELKQMRVWDITPGVELEDGLAQWRRFLAEGQLRGEYTLVAKDGTWLEVEFRATAHILPGVHLSVIRNVTDRRQAEEELRIRSAQFETLVRRAPIAIFLVDSELRILQVNRKAEEIFAVPAVDARGRRLQGVLRTLWGEENAQEIARLFHRTLETGQPFFAQERELRSPNGPTIHIEGRIDRIRLPGGGSGVICYFRDVSAQVAARAEIEELNRTLERRVEERTREVRRLAGSLTEVEQEERRRIARVLHDDLQQMLFALHVRLDLLREDVGALGAETLEQNLAQASRWTHEAIAATRQLSVELSPPVLDGDGIADAMEWLAGDVQEKHGLRVRLDAERAPAVVGNDVRLVLFHVIRELLFNVVKHADVGEAEIQVWQDGSDVRAVVADRGVGVEPALLSADSAAAGFGLVSVRERIELLGGHLEIRSQPGGGTRVEICAPLHPTRPADEPTR